MAKLQGSLKLGKGKSFFVKSQMKRLPQEDETWEADFQALPKPMTQTTTHFLGLVLTQPDGYLLADQEVEHTPTVNDLANLLAVAMRRPWIEGAHRPRCLHVRGNPVWNELVPHLKEIGVQVVVQDDLPKVSEAYSDYLRHMKKVRSPGKGKPSAKQEKRLPRGSQPSPSGCRSVAMLK